MSNRLHNIKTSFDMPFCVLFALITVSDLRFMLLISFLIDLLQVKITE